jgi:hypothetical protein
VTAFRPLFQFFESLPQASLIVLVELTAFELLHADSDLFLELPLPSLGVRPRLTPIGSCAANELFRGQYASKHGWNSRVCGRIRIIGYIGINNTPVL